MTFVEVDFRKGEFAWEKTPRLPPSPVVVEGRNCGCEGLVELRKGFGVWGARMGEEKSVPVVVDVVE